jgi:hypothetical protein
MALDAPGVNTGCLQRKLSYGGLSRMSLGIPLYKKLHKMLTKAYVFRIGSGGRRMVIL